MKIRYLLNTKRVSHLLLNTFTAVFLLFLIGCGGSSDNTTVVTPDTTAPVITITGDNPATVDHNAVYTDAGATANDNVDGNVNVSSSGAVDTSTLGTYTITYTATDAAGNQGTATRTVNVVDVTPPVITIIGNNPATVVQNANYTDAGATAVDDIDGAVDVTASGDVDTSTVGAYVITYTATDVAGNQAMAQRTVNVVPPSLKGVAAAGAAIVGTVTVKGSLGVSTSALIEANGNYNVDVTGLTAPYRIRAEGTVGGKIYRLYSYAEESDIGNTVNITPFTDLIVANTAQQLAESFFDSDVAVALDPEELAAQEAALQSKLQKVFDALGLDSAIDLLRTAFAADHSGLDAALDLVRIGTAEDNIVTITNLLDASSITDNILDPDDNADVLDIDPDAVMVAVSDTQAIANLFNTFSEAFAAGLPDPDDIDDLFSADFLENDAGRSEFLTEITTDPQIVGLGFTSVSISHLDSMLGTAMVSFNVIFEDRIDLEINSWLVSRDDVLGWQLRGDQRIVDIYDLSYHCNDFDGTDEFEGGCGINTSVRDNDFDNNGTGGLPIASASVKLIDGSDGTTVKHMLFMGTPENMTAGELHIYNEATGAYQGDWRAFGMGLGEVNPALFVPGDLIEYNLYTQDLDLTDPSSPEVMVGAEVATYVTTIEFEPSNVGLYPIATDQTQMDIANYEIGSDLTIEWILAEGTVSDEVLISISDSQFNRIEIWDESFSATTTSITFSAAVFESAIASNPNFDINSPDFSILVRIYAADEITGQFHSTDYWTDVIITGLSCGYESGWDDDADDGLGAPITPNSFADFEQVVASCGGSMPQTFADIAGKSFIDFDETITFSDTGAGTADDPGIGQVEDDFDGVVITFEWYIENVGGNSLLVIYSDSTIDQQLPEGFSIRETSALILVDGNAGEAGSEYHTVRYYEQSNYGDMIRDNGDDGEIWNAIVTLQ
jgi:hypothetical protein